MYLNKINHTKISYTKINYTKINYTKINYTKINYTKINYTKINHLYLFLKRGDISGFIFIFYLSCNSLSRPGAVW